MKHQLQEDSEGAFASNAEEALDVFDAGSFDLLLGDINLGEGNSGTEILHLLRDQETAEVIPAVAVTAYATPGDRVLSIYDTGHIHYFREHVRDHPQMKLVYPKEYL